MDIWLTFAYILDGEVKNIASYLYTGYTQANINAVSIYGMDAIAVDVTHIPVFIGDTYNYEENRFYRNGEEVKSIPSVAQQTSMNTANVASLNDTVDKLLVGILGGAVCLKN